MDEYKPNTNKLEDLSAREVNKICILAAGYGTRLAFSKFSSKALVPFGMSSALGYLIDLVPDNKKIIIAVNYFSEDILNYVSILYPKKQITFVNVQDINAINSGPSSSLLACKNELHEPFLLFACDSLPKKLPDLKVDTSWMAGFKKPNSNNYLNLKVVGNKITKFVDKPNEIQQAGNYFSFGGLALIKEYQNFFDGLEYGTKIKKSGEVIYGFNNLLAQGLCFKEIDWYEVGNDNDYKEQNIKSQHIQKDDEYIYFQSNKVVKFFITEKKSADFFSRSQFISNLGPSNLKQNGRFVSYEYFKGNPMSYIEDPTIILNVLDSLKFNLWDVPCYESLDTAKMGKIFYIDKTIARSNRAFENLEVRKTKVSINGKTVDSLDSQLSNINLNLLLKFKLSYFHGDPQPENIIVRDSKFIFIDWRADFAGSIKYGDCYYDLAKIYHALIISGRAVRQNKFQTTVLENKVNLKFSSYSNLIQMLRFFEAWCVQNNYNLVRIRLISSLILLNSSPLHERVYGTFLYYLGRLWLSMNDKEWEDFIENLSF